MHTLAPRGFFLARLSAAPLCVALASCASLAGGARDTFVGSKSCPADRVSVVAVPDSRYQDPLPPDPPPPADVAADAGRLAVWRQRRDAARKEGEQWHWRCGREMYEVTGCGARQVYCCDHPWVAQDPAHPGYDYGKVECSAVTP